MKIISFSVKPNLVLSKNIFVVKIIYFFIKLLQSLSNLVEIMNKGIFVGLLVFVVILSLSLYHYQENEKNKILKVNAKKIENSKKTQIFNYLAHHGTKSLNQKPKLSEKINSTEISSEKSVLTFTEPNDEYANDSKSRGEDF
jgi:hypothetical protein